jgi:hypothetical protein
LAHAGVPSTQLYGSDRDPNFLSTSYALFNDASRFHGTLVQADVFDSDLFSKAWAGWAGTFGIVHASLFLHLFDWEKQVLVCERIVKLLNGEKQNMFVGEMVGLEGAEEMDLEISGGKGVNFRKGEVKWGHYLHDPKSFEKMWNEIAEKTGTQGQWNVDCVFRKRAKGNGSSAFFNGEGIGWITFSVERI